MVKCLNSPFPNSLSFWSNQLIMVFCGFTVLLIWELEGL